MSHQFSVSRRGLKLIKAFEGFYPVDSALITGQRVVGYGHRVRDDKAMIVSRAEADELLLDDLAPYEDMVNKSIYAPLNQNQFDALCSLAFNIGPRAFENSEVLHAINNGRLLDAANSFDVWRKAQINNRIYVVDALMRRRATEKALFLRPETGRVAASRVRLKPLEDETVYGSIVDENLPIFDDDYEDSLVAQVPYTADIDADELNTRLMPARRRDDGPAGTLTLSETYDEEWARETEAPVQPGDFIIDEDEKVPSPIAVAAAEVSERLDALIEEKDDEKIVEAPSEWPESLITAEPTPEDIEEAIAPLEFTAPPTHDVEDAWRPETVQAERYEASNDAEAGDHIAEAADIDDDVRAVESSDIEETAPPPPPKSLKPDTATSEKPSGLGPYLIMIVTGLTLIGASLGAIYKGAEALLGPNGPFWASIGVLIGAMMVIGALYYVLKSIFTGR